MNVFVTAAKLLIFPAAILVAAVTIPTLMAWNFLFERKRERERSSTPSGTPRTWRRRRGATQPTAALGDHSRTLILSH